MTFHGGRITRRTVLRGLGGTVMSLPFLEAMLPAAAAVEAAKAPPRRMAFLYVPIGAAHGQLDAESRRRRL